MERLRRYGAVWAALLILAGVSPITHAGCTRQLLRGDYVMRLSAEHQVYSEVLLGDVTFDGKGALSWSATAFGDMPGSKRFSGTGAYSVARFMTWCAANINMSGGPPGYRIELQPVSLHLNRDKTRALGGGGNFYLDAQYTTLGGSIDMAQAPRPAPTQALLAHTFVTAYTDAPTSASNLVIYALTLDGSGTGKFTTMRGTDGVPSASQGSLRYSVAGNIVSVRLSQGTHSYGLHSDGNHEPGTGHGVRAVAKAPLAGPLCDECQPDARARRAALTSTSQGNISRACSTASPTSAP